MFRTIKCGVFIFFILISAGSWAVTPVLSPAEEGGGVVERFNAGKKQVIIGGVRFQIHFDTKVGEVVSWPGKVDKADVISIKPGDQVYFDAEFSKPEPYRLKYIYRLIK